MRHGTHTRALRTSRDGNGSLSKRPGMDIELTYERGLLHSIGPLEIFYDRLGPGRRVSGPRLVARSP
jgi:hypothetical protein